MTDSDLPDAGCPGKWPRKLRLGLEAVVTVMTDAYVMAGSRAAGSPSETVRLMGERDDGEERPAANEICQWRMCAKMYATDVLQT